jgi:hypothetical protein
MNEKEQIQTSLNGILGIKHFSLIVLVGVIRCYETSKIVAPLARQSSGKGIVRQTASSGELKAAYSSCPTR